MFILVEDSNGLINNVVLATSLTGGQTPQRNLRSDYWQQMYQRLPNCPNRQLQPANAL